MTVPTTLHICLTISKGVNKTRYKAFRECNLTFYFQVPEEVQTEQPPRLQHRHLRQRLFPALRKTRLWRWSNGSMFEASNPTACTLGRYCCKWIILAVFAAAPKVVGQGVPVHDYVDRYFYLGNNFNAPVIWAFKLQNLKFCKSGFKIFIRLDDWFSNFLNPTVTKLIILNFC